MNTKKEGIIIAVLILCTLLSYFFFDSFIGPFNIQFLDPLMKFLSIIGNFSWYALIIITLTIIGIFTRNKHLAYQGSFFICAVAIDSIILYFLKTTVARPRPILPNMVDSFPSGHASRSILAAKLWGGWYPAVSIILYALALLIGFSRIYFGLHYLSDVLAGFTLSYCTGCIYERIYNRYIEKQKNKHFPATFSTPPHVRAGWLKNIG